MNSRGSTANPPSRNGFLGLILLIAVQLGFEGGVFAATTNVAAFGTSFSPPSVTIRAGDSVTWTGLGFTHNVQTDTDPFCGLPPVAGGTCTIQFNEPGTYSYYCSPHQAFGMVGTVIVQSAGGSPPSVTITNPANGAVLAAPANVTIQASASDTDGSVTNVQFFANSNLLGVDATPPFSIVASNLAAGSYALAAVAADNSGLTRTSAVVNVSVVAGGVITLSAPIITNGQFRFNYTANAGLKYVV
ncbi:MAG TPA: Ig-like domain-containing protein, partial [Verrucomicrobiae bacterium]|nr:Ig-like domain-containing protein [Verrucomicrobiae bacterium]